MGASSGLGPSRRGRVGRVFRWQPENERQVWLYALWSGVSIGAVCSLTTYLLGGPFSRWWATEGLIPAGVFVIVFGLGQRYQLHKRQDARARAGVG
jgi:hypothetical protein